MVVSGKTISVLAFAGGMLVVAGNAAAEDGNAGLTVRKARGTGLATFITAADGGAIPLRLRAGKQKPEPLDFFATYGELFGVTDPSKQLVLHKIHTDRLGHTHTTFHQVQAGVPVFSGVLKVHQAADGTIIVVNGDFYPIGDKLNTIPTLDAKAAAARAKTAIRVGRPAVEHSKLVIVDPGWYADPPRGAHLAYYIILTDLSVPVREAFFVDAHSGGILDQWNLLHTSRDREVYDGQGLPNLPGVLVRSEGNPPVALADANLAYDYAGDVYDYFFRSFNRDSIDDGGMTLVLTVNSTAPPCPNAFWSGSQMVFCAGTVTDDVTAHEIGHGVTQYTADLIYQNQSGQLNESYSDIFGELIDLFNGNVAFPGPPGGTPWPTDPYYVSPGLDTPNNLRTACSYSPEHGDGVRWLLGEDAVAFGGAIRDMWEPTCMGDPDRAYHPYQTCDPFDNGGVHSGSGIPNHAFAILTDGKTFNGQTVTGIGPIKAAAVWYRALTIYLTVASDFEDAYYALNQAAADLIGTMIKDPRDASDYGQFFASDALEVDKALLAVEMNTEGACGATVPVLDSTPRNKCSGAQSVFSDDFEGGVGAWTVSNTGPYGPPTPYDWVQMTGGLPFGRSGTVWFAEDRNVGDCYSQDESAVHSLFSPVIGLPADLPSPTLSFTHYAETEPGYDGGNVKISVNGGAWQVIPSAVFQYNPYNGVLVGTNPLGGQEGWTGAGGRWGTSFIDLSSFVSGGEDVQFRFDFGKDGCYGITGWFVDDFGLYTCPPQMVKFSQPPTENGEDIASNIDWTDEAPNVVVADDFISDGRPITGLRWWGSRLGSSVVVASMAPPGTCPSRRAAMFNRIAPAPTDSAVAGDECPECISPGGTVVTGTTADNTGSTGDDTSCALADMIDEWYCYTTPCTGVGTASLCGSSYDTTLAVFDACGGTELACNNDGPCIPDDLSSELSWTVTEGVTYFLRVSGYEGDTGDYTVTLSCEPVVCGPGNGDCCSPAGNGSPGCDDADCCNLVCSGDPYCCDTEWDDICASAAQTECAVCQGPPFEGWFISFHEPLETGAPAQPALGVYFCYSVFVETGDTSLQACDGHPVVEYSVDLAYCCLLHAGVDSRTGAVPAQPGAFLEEQSLDYAVDIQAVIGGRFVDDGEGSCVEVSTGRSAVEDFWGWHSTSVESGARGAVTSVVTLPGTDWLYGPWADVTPTCSAHQNMAFELLTTGEQVECFPSSASQPEMIEDAQKQSHVSTKNRFLSFSAGDAGREQSIRVKFIDLPDPYHVFNDKYMWVGGPFDVTEIAGSTDTTPPTFKAAKLQCDKPLPRDWTTLTGDCLEGTCWSSANAGATCTDDSDCVPAVIHVYSEFIVPDGQYEIRVLDSSCLQSQIEDDAVAPPLFLETSPFGDVCAGLPLNNQGQWGPPDGVASITSDVIAVLNKSLNKPGLVKARAELGAEIGNPEPDLTIYIPRDVLYAVQAYLAQPYLFDPPPWPCP